MLTMRVLVAGGGGYIGSHTLLALLQNRHEVVVIDSFQNSSPEAIARVERLAGREVVVHTMDLRDEARLRTVLAEGEFDAVIHFAGLKAVGESLAKPSLYYGTNLESTLSLIRAMQASETRNLVFSSSATVYGPRAESPYLESFEPLEATNPYGRTKVMIEHILGDVAAADSSWNIGLLRYFNPVGAHSSGEIGEDPRGVPNNLTPYISQVAVGRLKKLGVFGSDYDTPDGTGLRDYVHVMDLAEGHVACLEYLAVTHVSCRAWNLGTGQGTSVLEMVSAFEQASGVAVPYELKPRRPGDLARCYANVDRAEKELGWVAKLGVDAMCADLWRWQSQNPRGYDA